MRKRGSGNIAALAVIVAVLAVLVFMAVTRQSNTVQANRNKLFDEVMSYDFYTDYPENPDGVLEKYCEIDRLLSGNTAGDFTDADLLAIVEKQRMLLHPELLELNPIETHVKGYADKIASLKKNEMRIMQIDMETPRFSDDAKICTIGVKQYWSGHTQVDLVYNIKKDHDNVKWKIIGWYINNQEEQAE